MRIAGLVTVAVAVASVTASSGCGGDEPGAAIELAPSQISAATVPEPTSVAACDVERLTFESSAGAGGAPEGSVAAVVRITNDGPVRCEVDVSESPLADPLMEPDVWIEPGGQAELLVEHDGSTCAAPSPVTTVELRVNGSALDVPVVVESTCGLSLTAVFAVEPGE